jgi:transposase
MVERAGASRADVRLDRHPRACVGGRRKRGVADKGYDAKTSREAARERGICPVIPYRSTPSTSRSSSLQSAGANRANDRQDQALQRIAFRCEKTATNYASFLALVCGFILIKSVHTA